MKNNNYWRKFVSLLCSQETRWSGISSLILLYFIVRDVSTVQFFLSNHYGRNSGKRIDQSSDKDHNNGKSGT